MNATFSVNIVNQVIDRLTESGMLIEQVGEDAYNVISNATGAVLSRLSTGADLTQYVRCIDYIQDRHGRDTENFKYVKPVHS
jgi:hypothetical protein